MSTDSEQNFARQVTQYLDHGTAQLGETVGYRLQLAREQALARYEEARIAPEMALATNTGSAWRETVNNGRFWISALALLGVLMAYQYWQSAQTIKELEETDSALLADELPIDAYLDRGFHNWLKRSEQ